MIIQTELTRDEEMALLFMLGLAAGASIRELQDYKLAKTLVTLSNKLMASNPNYEPYDPDSLDMSKQVFPFKTITKQ